jgi:transposase-like protein
MVTRPAIFKWRQTQPGLILCAVRWYLRYSLSLRDVEELLEERGLNVDHTTVWRWVQCYGPEAPIYSSAIPDSKKEGTLRHRCRHRPVQYLNNILEQDHRAIKRRVNAKQGFRGFQAAQRTIQGYEAVHMIRKGQIRWVAGDDLLRQIQFIDNLFDLAA